MSSNNNETSTVGAGLGVIVAGIAFLAAFLFAVFAFIAAILTVLCIIALFTPVKLGKWTLEAEEAGRFLWHGVVGAWMVPTFVLFCDVMFNIGIVWDYWHYMVLGGYVGGALGWELLTADSNAAKPEAEVLPPAQQITHQTSRSQPSPWQRQEPEQFGFASWDDEEEFRK